MSKVLVDRDLLPCPFCGSEEIMDMRYSGDARVQCAGCNASTDTYDSHIESHAAWNRRAQPAEAEGMSNARLMNTLAELARRAPLRTLHTICETQRQVSTVKLERYLEPVGDTLAGYAFTLRIDYDKLSAALSAVTAERDRLREDRDDCLEARQYYADKYGEVIAERERLRAELEMLRDNNRKAAISDAAMSAKEA